MKTGTLITKPSALIGSAISVPDRFDVGCEGELIHSYPDARSALHFAEWSAGITNCPHEIFDRDTGLALVIIDPPEAA